MIKDNLPEPIKEMEVMRIKTREEQLEATKDILAQIIRDEDLEDLIEQEVTFIGENKAIKRRLVNLFCAGHYTTRQLAQIFCVSTSTIARWLRFDDVKNAIQKYQEEEDAIASSMLKALRMKAIERQSDIIEHSDNDMVAGMMIKDVLDRTGHKPVEKKQVEVNMTYEERLAKLVEGVDYETVIDVDESDLSHNIQLKNTEGDANSD